MGAQQYGSARTFAFIGFIFYVRAAAIGIIGLIIFGLIFAASVSVSPTFPTSPTNVTFFPFSVFFILFLVLLIPAAFLALFAWTTVKAIDEGRIAQARTNSLILGIVGLIFGVVISGIFFLLAYANLGQPYQQPYQAYQPPPQQPRPQPQAQRYCVNCGQAIPSDSLYCPHCGKQQPT
jgi:hypothetical protein